MSRPAVPSPLPPGADAPPTCEVPHFAPVRVRGGSHRLHRLVRHRRRAVAAGLAVTAAALVAAGPLPGAGAQDGGRARGHPVTDRARERQAPRPVAAPVRIADAGTVRLLSPGDRVDVVASEDGAGASVIARGARVVEVPEPVAGAAGDGVSPGAGALVVLSVPPATAHRLVGAGARARLAVVLC
ncbi:RcpC/CpaB family pilus assembly protein [Streptomyces sp. NPDC047725]|uniref:RcpC/CpaB family pilus assembly protein n=1 Tax=Streptomyces sp. NPDC047725 TaxID=3365487 RepID=UPI00371A45A4